MARIVILWLVLVAAGAQPAEAYVGPGLGLGALGAVLGLLFSILLAVLALVWYPIKRVLGLGKRPRPAGGEAQQRSQTNA